MINRLTMYQYFVSLRETNDYDDSTSVLIAKRRLAIERATVAREHLDAITSPTHIC